MDHRQSHNLAPAHFPAGSRGHALVERRDPMVDSWFDDEGGSPSIDLGGYWRVILKHRWVIAGIFVGTVVLGIAVTLLMTPIYRSETTLQIDREAAKVMKTDEVEPTEQMIAGEEFFQTQYGLLKSRSLAIRVVDGLNLSANDNFLRSMGYSAEFRGDDGEKLKAQDLRTRRRLAAIKAFQDNLAVTPVRGSRLVRVSFDSPDPQLAAQIANATAENFIASNLDRRFESSSYARQFLEERLAQVKARLETSERQVVAYAEKQGIVNIQTQAPGEPSTPGASQSLTTNSLVSLNMALSTARGERIRAEQRWRQSQGVAGQGLVEAIQNPTIQELSQTRAKLQAEYEDKLRVYKPDFPDMLQLRSRLAELDKQIQGETRNVQGALKLQYEIALAQERAFERQVNELKSSVMDLRDRSIQYDILLREVDTNRTLYDGLLQRYKEIGVAGGISTNNVSIVDRAEVAEKPAKPKPLINVLVSALVGLGLGILVAFLIELLDESIGTPDDVEQKLGLPLLGSVPKLEKGATTLVVLEDPRSAMSEAYYSVRTALQFSTAEGAPSSLVVTSSRPAEGKSTTALAIAKGFARLGLRVLLVDGDLRNPSMHRNLGIDNSAGFSNYLTGSAPLAELVQETSVPTLSFIPCGPLPPNPAELLAGARLKSFLAEAKSMFEMVIIDGPPVLGLADAPMLAASMSGAVFVIESGGTRRGVAKTAIRRLQVGHARVVGAVLTKFNAKKASYGAGYAYSYDYEYGSRPQIGS